VNRNQTCAAIAASSAFVVGASIAQASFVGFFVSSNQVSLGGNNLIVYTLTARFDESSDTVFRALDLHTENAAWLEGFWHKDNHGSPSTNGLLSQEFGTWNRKPPLRLLPDHRGNCPSEQRHAGRGRVVRRKQEHPSRVGPG